MTTWRILGVDNANGESRSVKVVACCPLCHNPLTPNGENYLMCKKGLHPVAFVHNDSVVWKRL
jgi:hypothetical protein